MAAFVEVLPDLWLRPYTVLGWNFRGVEGRAVAVLCIDRTEYAHNFTSRREAIGWMTVVAIDMDLEEQEEQEEEDDAAE